MNAARAAINQDAATSGCFEEPKRKSVVEKSDGLAEWKNNTKNAIIECKAVNIAWEMGEQWDDEF